MLEAFAMSDKGCVRSNNEDYCLIDPQRGLYVLADGMGGAKAGERASRMAVDTVKEGLESPAVILVGNAIGEAVDWVPNNASGALAAA